MVTLVRKENEQDQVYLFQDIYSESCKMCQLETMCHFEHTNS